MSTANAKNKVKAWFKRRERNENIERGEKQILRTLRLSNIEDSEIVLTNMLENDTYENFAYKVGTGDISNQKIIDLINKQQLEETVRKMNLADDQIENHKETSSVSSVVIIGESNNDKKLANCCNVVYGDEIVGYKNSSNEIVIHRIFCSRLRNFERTNRFLPAVWGHSKELSPTTVVIEAYDLSLIHI